MTEHFLPQPAAASLWNSLPSHVTAAPVSLRLLLSS